MYLSDRTLWRIVFGLLAVAVALPVAALVFA
jgi:hypothetical protein